MRKERFYRILSFYLAINILFEVISPTVALALTNGSYQSDFESFEPSGTTEMVDLFSGDYKYNIPLMDVEGYPINLFYHAGANMEQEASWVGLGWNINAGVTNRILKGLPDDFNGEKVSNYLNIKKNVTIGVGMVNKFSHGSGVSAFGVGFGPGFSVGSNASLVYNNYKGFGAEISFDADHYVSGSILVFNMNKSKGHGIKISSLDGGEFTTRVGQGWGIGHWYNKNIGVGTTYNTRSGLENKTYYSTQSQVIADPINRPAETLVNFNISGGHNNDVNETVQQIPVSSTAYQPKIEFDMFSSGNAKEFLMGMYSCLGFRWGVFDFSSSTGAYSGFTGYYNTSDLVTRMKDNSAYGYMYLQNADDNSIIDYNRTNSSDFYDETPAMPMSSQTFDIFSVSGQGIGTAFRSHRNEVGMVYDNLGKVSSKSNSQDFEMGFGSIMRIQNVKSQAVYMGFNGKWNNNGAGNLKYHNKNVFSNNEKLQETSYFKCLGEKNTTDDAFMAKVGYDTPIRPDLIPIADEYGAVSNLPGTINSSSPDLINTNRVKRKTNVRYLTLDETKKFGLDKQIKNYRMNDFSFDAFKREISSYTLNDRETFAGLTPTGANNVKSNHISEISVTQNNGSRYIYGFPIYNKSTKSVAFNISDRRETGFNHFSNNPRTRNPFTGNVDYNPGFDNSLSNDRGLEHLYKAEITPAYAQSYLLTAIVSDDYVDRSQNGISDDDFGSFTKFNYTKSNTEYQWRVPYGNNEAIYDDGLLADNLDDKAAYQYGKRDVCYLHSVETKNYVAEFTLSKRKDGAGVMDENGVIDPNADVYPYKLDKIELYSKEEKAKQTADPTYIPVPLKTVIFEYDYSLCGNVYNNIGGADIDSNGNDRNAKHGKLTLRKIYFTYGKSNKSKFNPYEFFYGDSNHDNNEESVLNPNYNPMAIDRWGNYKPNNSVASGAGSSSLNNKEFPYSEQNKSNADEYAGAWNLSTIYSPSGSKLNIDYEADDYGYVQDQPVGQIFKIWSIEKSKGDFLSPSRNINLKNIFLKQARYLVIDLSCLNNGNGVLSSEATPAFLKDKILGNLSQIYFKCLVEIGKPTSNTYEYVPGYADIDLSDCSFDINHTNVVGSDTYLKFAFVKIKHPGIGDDGSGIPVSPISKAAWQMARMYLPRIVYPGSEPTNTSSNPLSYFSSIISGLGTAIVDMATRKNPGEHNIRFLNQNYSSRFDPTKSWVRLYNPYKSKKGGGHRVKRITMDDNWNAMIASEDKSVYGQEFSYTIDENGNEISSGVSSYEPLSGGDENSLHKKVEFSIDHNFAPNDDLFLEEPYGEVLYPSARVGYRKVTVKNIDHVVTSGPNSNKKVCEIGKTEYQFYTAKDFPIVLNKTSLEKELIETDPQKNDYEVANYFTRQLYLSQGYTLKLNDMHGALKSISLFEQGNSVAPLSGVQYFYKSKTNGKELDNKVNVTNSQGLIRQATIGQETDVVNDSRISHNFSVLFGIGKEFTMTPCSGLFPTVNPIFRFSANKIITATSVNTKIEQTYGVLDRVVNFDNHSSIETKNLLWDENTGDVVLTKTVNNNNAPVYAFSYPAYWIYKGMGQEFENEGMTMFSQANSTYNTTNGLLDNSVSNLFNSGDEIIVYNVDISSNPYSLSLINDKFWVLKDSNNDMFLIDKHGKKATQSNGYFSSLLGTNFLFKVLKSGKTNQLSQNAGSLTTLNNPIQGNSNTPLMLNNQLISSNAVEFSNTYAAYCVDDNDKADDLPYELNSSYLPLVNIKGKIVNPFLMGEINSYKPYKSYDYKINRNYNNIQVDIKNDGKYSGYKEFWKYEPTFSEWQPVYSLNRSDFYSAQPFDRWVNKGGTTMINPFGLLLESKDAIGLYSSNLYYFNQSLIKAKASNSMNRLMSYDCFEDYKEYLNLGYIINNIADDHIGFRKYYQNVTKQYAHTGLKSLKITPTQPIILNRKIRDLKCEDYFQDGVYKANCTCNYGFSPIANINTTQDFVISFWIKSPLNSIGNFANDVILDINGVLAYSQKTNIIDGWQKLEYKYSLPANSNAGNFIINIKNNTSTSSDIFIDDFRIQPFNSSMVGYVNDPYTLRLMAELDDRNFATIYEYDNEGKLIRNKKETEKGIFTISEKRSSLKKR